MRAGGGKQRGSAHARPETRAGSLWPRGFLFLCVPAHAQRDPSRVFRVRGNGGFFAFSFPAICGFPPPSCSPVPYRLLTVHWNVTVRVRLSFLWLPLLGKSCPRTSKATPREKQSEVSPDSDDLIRMLESETLLLTYASLKMEKNTAFLEEQAERNLLTLSREAARLQADAQKKRHRLQRLKKDRQLSESLDRQLEVLGPVCEQIRAFEEEYRHFATALDTARHELPVNEIYLGGDKSQYLDDLQRALAATQEALRRALPEHAKENAKGLSVAKELEETSLEVAAELPRTVAHVLDLSADVGKEASLRCQKVFEDTQGVEKMKQLYFG